MILSLEARSIDYYKARAKQINGPSDFNKALNFIESNEVFYDYLVIDTITKLDEWAEWVGTYNYMKSPPGVRSLTDLAKIQQLQLIRWVIPTFKVFTH